MSFTTAKLRGAMTPPIRELPVAAGAVFLRGAALVRDGNGAWAECGANPAAIGGFAESDYGPDTVGFTRLSTKEFPPGYMQATSPANDQVFMCRYMGTLPAADGGSYGITRDTDLLWKIDFAKTAGDARLVLVGRMTAAPENRNKVLVTVLPANVQVVV